MIKFIRLQIPAGLYRWFNVKDIACLKPTMEGDEVTGTAVSLREAHCARCCREDEPMELYSPLPPEELAAILNGQKEE